MSIIANKPGSAILHDVSIISIRKIRSRNQLKRQYNQNDVILPISPLNDVVVPRNTSLSDNVALFYPSGSFVAFLTA
jgi:hypothetical protein